MHTSTGARSLRIERVTEQIQIVLPAIGRPVSLEDSRHVLCSRCRIEPAPRWSLGR
jgi:hypothetical protein